MPYVIVISPEKGPELYYKAYFERLPTREDVVEDIRMVMYESSGEETMQLASVLHAVLSFEWPSKRYPGYFRVCETSKHYKIIIESFEFCKQKTRSFTF